MTKRENRLQRPLVDEDVDRQKTIQSETWGENYTESYNKIQKCRMCVTPSQETGETLNNIYILWHCPAQSLILMCMNRGLPREIAYLIFLHRFTIMSSMYNEMLLML